MPYSTSGKYYFNRKEFYYFSTKIIGKATVFFWILDNLVYNMSNTYMRSKRNKELYRTSLLFWFIWNKVGQVYINTELGHLTPAFLGRTPTTSFLHT
jgi:hypothetical protein